MNLMEEKIPDGKHTYHETGSGGGGGDAITEYPSYDLGVQKGGHAPDKVYRLDTATAEDAGVFVEVTTEARSLVGSTFDAIEVGEVQYSALYIGFRKKFCGVRVDIQTKGVESGLVATWEYPSAIDSEKKPSTWVDFVESDGSTNLTVATGVKDVKWIIGTDWVKSRLLLDSGEYTPELYWVKFMIATAGYSVAPILTSIQVIRPVPATALSIRSTVDDDCDLYLNSTLSGGSVTKVGNKDSVELGKAFWIEDLRVYNFTIENLANTQICEIHVKGFVGSDLNGA